MSSIIKASLLFLFITTVLFCQDETLVDIGKIESGGYGALVINFTNVKHDFGVMVGGYGGWLINHSFLLGGGGFGLANNIQAPNSAQPNGSNTSSENLLYIKEGYGGLILEYIFNSKKLVHYNIQTLIGGGGVTYSLKNQYDVNEDKNCPFFVWEIGANAEFNIVKYFHLCLGGKYRLTSGVDMEGLSDSDLSGANLALTFKFGSF